MNKAKTGLTRSIMNIFELALIDQIDLHAIASCNLFVYDNDVIVKTDESDPSAHDI